MHIAIGEGYGYANAPGKKLYKISKFTFLKIEFIFFSVAFFVPFM